MIVEDHCHWLVLLVKYKLKLAVTSQKSQFCVQYATISMACGQTIYQNLLELLENSTVDTDPHCQQLELSLDLADQAQA